LLDNGEIGKSMRRTFALILAALAAAALFAGLVHAVLVAAHVSEPAATTVYGLTPRRLWATTVAVLALVGVVIGGLALAPARPVVLGPPPGDSELSWPW
jgi:preprotein translocase subunit SecE